MLSKATLIKLILLRRLRRRLRRKPRSIYIRSIFLRRDSYGETTLVNELRNDRLYHFKYFRMDKENFDEILRRIQLKISHAGTHSRPISAFQRLAMTIRYLASGNSQISVAMNYRISPSAVCGILRETMTAICEAFSEDYLAQPTEETWIRNEAEFAKFWDFLNACGAIDGKHIRIKAPHSSGSTFFNYKSYFSIVLLAICNANYMFTAVDIGSYGSESDGGIFMRSNIGKRLELNLLSLPSPKPIDITGKPIAHVILGDSGFPLKPYLMCPYKGEFIAKEKRIFNYRLSRARMVVENSFGILAARWRIFQTMINGDVELVKLITRTSVILHNFLMSKKDFNAITVDHIEDGILSLGNWRETTQLDQGLTSIPTQGSSNFSSTAAETRSDFTNYFMSNGRVSWQDGR